MSYCVPGRPRPRIRPSGVDGVMEYAIAHAGRPFRADLWGHRHPGLEAPGLFCALASRESGYHEIPH